MANLPMHRRKRCGAKTKSGKPCQAWGMENGRCRVHGGPTPKGMGSPNFKHGRRSKYLPTRLIEDAMKAWEDPELHSLHEDIVTVDARISDLQRRLDTGESGAAWKALRDAVLELRKARMKRDGQDEAVYWQDVIESTIMEGAGDYDAWNELIQTIDKRASLIDREQKRRQTNHEMISADRALAMFASLIHIVRETVHDPHALSEISRHASRIMGSPDVIDIDQLAQLGPGERS